MQHHDFGKQLVRDRRRPLGVLLGQARESAVACGLRRLRGADVVGTVAPLVELIRDSNLVARARLPRDSNAAVDLGAFVHPWIAGIGNVEPLSRLELVQIPEDRGLVRGLVEPGGEPEPHLVPLERTTKRLVQVHRFDNAVGRRQPGGPELLREVVALQALVGEREERGVGEAVAAVLRHEVDTHAARGQVRGEGARVNGDLGRRADVGCLTADVATGLEGHGVDAVDRHALIHVAAAVSGHALPPTSWISDPPTSLPPPSVPGIMRASPK